MEADRAIESLVFNEPDRRTSFLTSRVQPVVFVLEGVAALFEFDQAIPGVEVATFFMVPVGTPR
jgi:hypothetical protein